MFKIKEIVKTANEAITEILKDIKIWIWLRWATYPCSSNSYYRRSKWNRMLQIRNSASKNTPVG